MEPSCFISYSWDSEAHKAWVRSLAERLQSNGVRVYLDQWDVRPGSDVTRYMETSVRESGFVVLICTEMFAGKANSGLGGVGYEKTIVTGEVFTRLAPETKFVPVLRSGDQRTALPSYLRAKVFIDFRRDDDFEAGLEILLRHLHGAPEFTRPPLGTRPVFEPPAAVSSQAVPVPASPPRTGERKFELATFDTLYRYAYESSGLNLTKDQAVAWAGEKTRQGSGFDLKLFRELFRYAYEVSGLNFTKEQAVVWAEDKVRQVPAFDLKRFEELFRYAYESTGLNLTKGQAVAWAEEKVKVGPAFDLTGFQQLYRYAYESTGLNLTKEQAIKWAEEQRSTLT